MQLNDDASDEDRQWLLPFVTRLACADTPEVERKRKAYIAARLRWRQSFRVRLAILEGALAIGRQADMPPEQVRTRLEGVRRGAAGATSVSEPAPWSTFQLWPIGVF
jgi:hypothetical protein